MWAQAQFAPIRYARASGLAFQVLELLRRMNVVSVGFAITLPQKKPGEENFRRVSLRTKDQQAKNTWNEQELRIAPLPCLCQ